MPERPPKRLCEVCLQYDDHPRIVIGVTTDGPLGLHSGGQITQVVGLLAPLLPANAAQVDKAVEGKDPAEAERIIADLIPDVDEWDAYRALRQFLHPQHFDAHLDCYRDDVPEVDKPQLAVDGWMAETSDPETGEPLTFKQVSWEDKRKIMPSDYALEQVGKLKGDELRAHLTADPSIDVDLAHGAVPA